MFLTIIGILAVIFLILNAVFTYIVRKPSKYKALSIALDMFSAITIVGSLLIK